MGKRNYLILTVLISSILFASCAKSEPVNTVEYAEVCNASNKGKTVVVQGFWGYGHKTPCVSMLRGDMKRDCGFKFFDKINVAGEEIIAYLREGKENNQAETPETDQANIKPSAGFENEQVKFRLDDGTIVGAQENVATPVTITGEILLNEADEKKGCSFLVSKIEKR